MRLWRGRWGTIPQPRILETLALPIALLPNIWYSSVRNVKRLSALPKEKEKLQRRHSVVVVPTMGFEPILKGFSYYSMLPWPLYCVVVWTMSSPCAKRLGGWYIVSTHL